MNVTPVVVENTETSVIKLTFKYNKTKFKNITFFEKKTRTFASGCILHIYNEIW